YILSKQPEKALATYRKILEMDRAQPSSRGDGLFAGAHIAVLADGLGDSGLRDRTLDEIAAANAEKAPRMSRICRLLRDWLARPEPDPADFSKVDEVYSAMPDDGRASFGYFIGTLLDQHGLKEKALKYHGDVVRIEKGPYLMRYLSSNALRDRGLRVGPNG